MEDSSCKVGVVFDMQFGDLMHQRDLGEERFLMKSRGETKEGSITDICPWTYVGQKSHDEGRDTCLFHRIDLAYSNFS